MTGESLVGPSLIGAGLFLFGWLAGGGRRRLRRVYHLLECRRHGLFPRSMFKADRPVCPMCGNEMKSITVTPWPRRRKHHRRMRKHVQPESD